ncbi:MAG: hypothetical protein U1F37_16940 [Alphaproteobacteria bacterium]
MADRDDDLSWWDELRSPPGGDEDSSRLPPFAWTSDGISALDHVRSLFRQPLHGATAAPPAPTWRDAAAEWLRAAGLFGETPAADDAATANTGAPADATRPPSWKPPTRGTPPTILGDDTAAGPLRGAGPNFAPAPSASDLPGVNAPSAAPRDPAAPATSSPLDHPDARTGLALTAADALLTKGIDLAVNLAGGDPAVARKLVEAAANSLAGVLPQEFRASALSSAAAAAAEAERRIGDNGRATRTRAALGTLANHRSEAEHEHAAAVIAVDRSKIEEARRDAIDAWRAERRARGDGEAEIVAAARALEREYRKTALRHRLAQMDGAGIQRALDEDEDAKADPGMAREVAGDILRLRRDDPARAGEASIEREIAARKRDGRIDTSEEETAARYKLRLEAQARRGIPEAGRRLLTNNERTAFALEYHRIESSQGKEAADAWLEAEAQKVGSNAERLSTELAIPPSVSTAPNRERITQSRQIAEHPGAAEDLPPSSSNDGGIEPAQDQRRSDPAETASRGARAARVLERYREFRSQNPGATRVERDAAIERFAIEEGELPADVARYFASRLRQPREEKDMATFIAEARRIVRLADALPHSVGPEGIPKETLRVARSIMEAADNDPAEAERNPRKVIIDGIRAASEDAFDDGEVIDPMIPYAVGMTVEPLRRRGARPSGRPSGSSPEQRDAANKRFQANKWAGVRTESQAIDIISRDIERMNISPQAKRLVRVEGKKGTIPDLPLGTKHDQIDVFVEIKKLGTRHRNPQRDRLRAIGAHILEFDPDTGASRALVPPYDDWISYEEWLRFLEDQLARRSRP